MPGICSRSSRGDRDLTQQLAPQLDLAGGEEFLDSLGGRFADAGELGEFVLLGDAREIGREILDGPRGAAVGIHAKDVRAADLKQVGDFLKDARNVGVDHDRYSRGWWPTAL